MSIVDRAEHKLYEAYAADYADGALRSASLVVWDLDHVYPPSGRGDQCASADAAGLPIAPLLFNADELAAGSINHAIRFVLPNDRIRAHVFVHPATHAGSPKGPELALPYGAHLRLKASFDMSSFRRRHGSWLAHCKSMECSCPTADKSLLMGKTIKIQSPSTRILASIPILYSPYRFRILRSSKCRLPSR